MNVGSDPIFTSTDNKLTFERSARFFGELAALYSDMDMAFERTAAYYGFVCHGCADNCCLTLFYHHTYVEYGYLISGFHQLPPDRQNEIRQRAERVAGQSQAAASQGLTPRIMCALNEHGKCLLYAFRPMICRLHGIPHELHLPGRSVRYGRGCSEFHRVCTSKEYMAFDRTPFYLALADLERRFKEAFGFSGKFKKTVSEFFL